MLFVTFEANKVISNTYFCLKLILKFMGAKAVLKTTSLS